MRPSLAVKNALDLLAADSESVRYILSRPRHDASSGTPAKRITALRQLGELFYLAHRFFGQLTHGVLCASTGALFHRCISHIVKLRPEEKMGWVYAKRVIAGVANKQSPWNWSKSKFPLEPTRNMILGAFRGYSKREKPVPLVINARFPVPAPFAFIVLRAETVDNFLGNVHLYIVPRGAAQ